MLQQTRMDVVLRYFGPFIARFPSPASLAAADLDEVVAQWSGMGYYRRARMLHRGAVHVTKENGGQIPHDPEALRKIPGIGRYTAGAIASIAFDLPAAIVDGNVARVLARIFAIDAPLRSAEFEKAAWRMAEAGPREASSDGDEASSGFGGEPATSSAGSGSSDERLRECAPERRPVGGDCDGCCTTPLTLTARVTDRRGVCVRDTAAADTSSAPFCG